MTTKIDVPTKPWLSIVQDRNTIYCLHQKVPAVVFLFFFFSFLPIIFYMVRRAFVGVSFILKIFRMVKSPTEVLKRIARFEYLSLPKFFAGQKYSYGKEPMLGSLKKLQSNWVKYLKFYCRFRLNE